MSYNNKPITKNASKNLKWLRKYTLKGKPDGNRNKKAQHKLRFQYIT
jgi:hypothetical protein